MACLDNQIRAEFGHCTSWKMKIPQSPAMQRAEDDNYGVRTACGALALKSIAVHFKRV
jgi:hypothetical protein